MKRSVSLTVALLLAAGIAHADDTRTLKDLKQHDIEVHKDNKVDASSSKAPCNSPSAGGAAKRPPMIANRNRAHRSRSSRSLSLLNIELHTSTALGGAQRREPSVAIPSASSAGEASMTRRPRIT